MAANVVVHKGGRLKLHVDSLSNTNNTFKIPSNFRIEYVYLIFTSTISSLQGIDLTIVPTVDSESGSYGSSLSILKEIPFYFSGASGSFVDLTPRVNKKLFDYNETTSTGYDVTVISYVSNLTTPDGTWTAPFKIIVGLESII